MARINKSALTRLEIIQEASKQFLEKGYSSTSLSSICRELHMSTGNLTFYFPTKEHLLAELVDMLCSFQWKLMEKEADEGISSILAICLELASMTSACEADPVIRDFLLSSYSSPICLDIIRRNDVARAKEVFKAHRPEWTDAQFAEAEILVSGIEYATMMIAGEPVPMEIRVTGALNNILGIYGIDEETRKLKTQKVFALDYRNLGTKSLREFKKFVEKANDQAIHHLLKR